MIGYADVISDGNCGYRSIARSLGWPQEDWTFVKTTLYNELNKRKRLYAPTFLHQSYDYNLEALQHVSDGFAPMKTWLSLPEMGFLVATAFQKAFVSVGACNRTFLPLTLTPGYTCADIGTFSICLLPDVPHYILVCEAIYFV